MRIIKYTRKGVFCITVLYIIPVRVYYAYMNTIGQTVRKLRKEAGLTQEEFAIRSGLGLRFVRELEQGKQTVRLDKVDQALNMFGMEVTACKVTTAEDSDADKGW